jgi:excisionase family DNA binding protein
MTAPDPIREQKLTIIQTARLLGVSRGIVDRAIASGELRSYRFGDAAIRIPISAIREYLTACSKGGES